MPKLKTRRGAAKRFKLTSSGKVRRYSAYRRHILSHKTTKQKRHLRQHGVVSPADERAVKYLIPFL